MWRMNEYRMGESKILEKHFTKKKVRTVLDARVPCSNAKDWKASDRKISG